MKRKWWLAGVIVANLGMLAVWAITLAPAALADTFGRPVHFGWYNGADYNGAAVGVNNNWEKWVFESGFPRNWQTNTPTADSFIAEARAFLNNDPGTPPQAAARMSAIINMMMGVRADDPRLTGAPNVRYQSGITLANNLFSQWSDMVHRYDDGVIPRASVEWKVIHVVPDNSINGYGILNSPDRNDNSGQLPDMVFSDTGGSAESSIIFHHPDGTVFSIKNKCGNLTGDESAFPADWSHEPHIAKTSPVGAFPGSQAAPGTLNLSVPGNQLLGFAGTARNIGAVNSPGGNLAGYVQINGGSAQPLGYVPPETGSFAGLAPNATSPSVPFATYNATGASAGTLLCFFSRVTPANSSSPASSADSNKLCYTVVYQVEPAIEAHSGDIHAGGGLNAGGVCIRSGIAHGGSTSGSYGDYVVSAQGPVSGIGSNGNASSSSATIANYGYVCRPDLVAAAQVLEQQPAGPGTWTPLPAGTYTLGSLPFSPSGVYIHDTPGDIVIHGTIPAKITIVALQGNIIIDGNIGLPGGPVTGQTAPSLGLVARNSILINPNVTSVSAYLFADGTINTCNAAAAACRTTLTVNGFLMGANLEFRRLGPISNGGYVPGEVINLTGQLYTNPPKLFAQLPSTINLLSSQGERPPIR